MAIERITLFAAAVLAVLLTAAGASAGRNDRQVCVGTQLGCFATVQAAVDAAQNGDTIRIRPGTYAGGVTVTKDVTLRGEGNAVLSGGGSVLTIGSRTTTPTVTVSHLVITGGLATTNPQAPNCGPDVPTCGPGYPDATALGGGIEAFPGSNVTVEHSLVTGNESRPARTTSSVKAVCPGEVPCPASFGSGAGIDNWGDMTVDHSTVSDNHGVAVQSDGGGIVAERGSTLTVRHSAVIGNSATAAFPTGRFAAGGGLFADHGSSLVVVDSTLDGNQVSLANSFPHPYPKQDGAPDNAVASDAALMFFGSSLTISGSHLDGNTVTVTKSVGEAAGFEAAFCGCGDSFTLADSTIDDNHVTVNVQSTADVGPLGPSAFSGGGGQAEIDGAEIRRNSIDVTASDGDAGAFGTVAMFGDQEPTMTITDSQIRDNAVNASTLNGDATVLGAGILNNAALLLDNVQIRDNAGRADGPTGSAQGGGIWNGDLFVPHDTPPPVTLDHTSITDNTLTGSPGVTLQGGGLFTDGFPVTLDDSRIENNTPDQCVGC